MPAHGSHTPLCATIQRLGGFELHIEAHQLRVADPLQVGWVSKLSGEDQSVPYDVVRRYTPGAPSCHGECQAARVELAEGKKPERDEVRKHWG